MKNLQLFLTLFFASLLYSQHKFAECSFKNNENNFKNFEILKPVNLTNINKSLVIDFPSTEKEIISKTNAGHYDLVKIHLTLKSSNELPEIFVSTNSKNWKKIHTIHQTNDNQDLKINFTAENRKKLLYIKLKFNISETVEIKNISLFGYVDREMIIPVVD